MDINAQIQAENQAPEKKHLGASLHLSEAYSRSESQLLTFFKLQDKLKNEEKS